MITERGKKHQTGAGNQQSLHSRVDSRGFIAGVLCDLIWCALHVYTTSATWKPSSVMGHSGDNITSLHHVTIKRITQESTNVGKYT